MITSIDVVYELTESLETQIKIHTSLLNLYQNNAKSS